MGPNDETNYIMTLDGQPVELADFTGDTTTKSESEEFAKFGQNVVDGFAAGTKKFECEFKYTTPKRYRCTNRKRYIKLRMADGASRNRANTEARLFAELVGFSYQEIYQQLPIMMSLLNVGFSLGHLRNWFSLNA